MSAPWMVIQLVATWIALAGAMSAVGVSFLHLGGRLPASLESAYLATWVGSALVVVALLGWNFVLPVDLRATAAFSIASIACAVAERKWWASLLRRPPPARLFAVAALFATWCALHALGPGGMDDFNYEYLAIRWAHAYRVVPGLANLNVRLGLNNSHHLLGALVSVGRWAGGAHHVLNGFFVTLLFAGVLAALDRLRRPEADAADLFLSALLAPCLGLVLFGPFGSMVSTLKVDVLLAAVVAILSYAFLRGYGPAPTSRGVPHLAAAVLLAGVAVSLKTSALVYSVVILSGASLWAWQRRYALRPEDRRLLAAAAGMGGLGVALYLARGVVLSGYPLFPSSAVFAPVDWRVPKSQAVAIRTFVTTWAQLRPTYSPAAATAGRWFWSWASSTILTDKYSIGLPSLILVLLIPFRRSPADVVRAFRRTGVIWVFSASICAIAAWFTLAPAGRFGFVYFWTALASTLACEEREPASGLLRRWGTSAGVFVLVAVGLYFALASGSPLTVPGPYRRGLYAVTAGAFVLASILGLARAQRNRAALLVGLMLLGTLQVGDRVLAHALGGRLSELGELGGGMVEREADSRGKVGSWRTTRSGLPVFQVDSALTWGAPLLSCRYFNPYLELRHEGNLSLGFRSGLPYDGDDPRYSPRWADEDGRDLGVAEEGFDQGGMQ